MPAKSNSSWESMDPNEPLQVFSFKYRVRINSGQAGFSKIKRDLTAGLARSIGISNERSENELNLVYSFIFRRFKTRFELSDNSRAYLTDYYERPGSLVITFTLLIITTITNYGSIRETADYFAEDIESIFTASLDENIGYNVSASVDKEHAYSFGNNQESESSKAWFLLNDSLKMLSKRIKVAYGLSFFAILTTLAFAGVNFYNRERDDSKGTNNVLSQDEVARIIATEIRNSRIDEHLQTKRDTVFVIRR